MKKNLFGIMSAIVLISSFPAPLRSENTPDYIAKGNMLVNKNKYTAAIEEYQKAAKTDPKNNRITLLISLCYAQSGDLDKGLSYAQLASQNDPSYASFYNLGLIYSARKESDDAIKAFDQALTLNPKSFDAEYQKGLAYTNLKQYDQAIPAFQKGLTLNPDADNMRLALFDAFLSRGDRNSASARIEKFRKMKKTAIVQALEARMKEATSVS